jgi:hypothetical protein
MLRLNVLSTACLFSSDNEFAVLGKGCLGHSSYVFVHIQVHDHLIGWIS